MLIINYLKLSYYFFIKMTDYNKFHGFDETKLIFDEEEIKIVDDNKYVTKYTKDNEGLITKHTKIYKLEKRIITIPKNVLERRTWEKFGVSKGLPKGPDTASTNIVVDEVLFEFTNNKKINDDKVEPNNLFNSTKNAVTCKYCEGNHWSIKCPNKELIKLKDSNDTNDTNDTKDSNTKYVPKFKREGAQPQKLNRNRNTIKITNITDSATEQDIRDLFINYGRITKLYYTNKGFAYLTFSELHSCEKAIEVVDGHPYDYLILKVEMAENK